MQKIFLIFLGLVFITGCGFQVVKDNMNTANSSVVNEAGIKLTDSAQEAIFYIGTGMDGGMGSMPVRNEQESYNLSYNDLPVFFSESFASQVRAKLPACYSGQPEIKVSANIILEKQSAVNHSIPPDENGDQPSESYYTVKVNKLNDIQVKAEKCKD